MPSGEVPDLDVMHFENVRTRAHVLRESKAHATKNVHIDSSWVSGIGVRVLNPNAHIDTSLAGSGAGPHLRWQHPTSGR
jgi:hypothetical protein